jgi:hypothetical protein
MIWSVGTLRAALFRPHGGSDFRRDCEDALIWTGRCQTRCVSDSRGRQPNGSTQGPEPERGRPYIKPIALLAVAAVALYLLLPSLVSVLSSWRSLEHLDWPFAALVRVFEIASSVCLWEIDRIALGVDGWFAVASAQLAGNAIGRVIPGSATPSTVVMLRKAGFDGGDAAAALTASTGLQIATALALPVLAVPAILGGAPVARGLATAAYVGVAVVVLLLAAGALLFTFDAPLVWVGRVVQSLLNATVRRKRPMQGLPEELPTSCSITGTSNDPPARSGWRGRRAGIHSRAGPSRVLQG